MGGREDLALGLGVRMEELEEGPGELGVHTAVYLIDEEDPLEFGEVDQYGDQVEEPPRSIGLLPHLELDRSAAVRALVAHDQLVALHRSGSIAREAEAARGGVEDRHRLVVGKVLQYLCQEGLRHQAPIGDGVEFPDLHPLDTQPQDIEKLVIVVLKAIVGSYQVCDGIGPGLRVDDDQLVPDPLVEGSEPGAVALDGFSQEELVLARPPRDELKELAVLGLLEEGAREDLALTIHHGPGKEVLLGGLADQGQPLLEDLPVIEGGAIGIEGVVELELELEGARLGGSALPELEGNPVDGLIAPGPGEDELPHDIEALDQVGLAGGIGPIDQGGLEDAGITPPHTSYDMVFVAVGLACEEADGLGAIEGEEVLKCGA